MALTDTAGQTLYLHRQAPAKPAYGAPCNRCGVCCTAEPCPAGILLFHQRRGRCPALIWTGDAYACRLVTEPDQALRWLPKWLDKTASRCFARWIAAGKGCDCAYDCDQPTP